MALSITHSTVVVTSDDGTSEVGTNEWNAAHTLAGLGAGVDDWLSTPSSANLKTAVTDETGSGALVFANTPTLVTPILGIPTSGTLTNCAGLPSVVVANEATDTTCFPAFFTAATGELAPKTNANLTFNSSTGALGFAGGTLTGHLLFSGDDTYDIGASGATRPRSIYLARQAIVGTSSAGGVNFQNSIQYYSNGSNSLVLTLGGGSFTFSRDAVTTGAFRVDNLFQSAGKVVPMAGELTIAAGVIAVSGGYHRVDTQSDDATDDLDTITGTIDGMIVTLRAENDARTVVVKDGTGNLQIAGDMTLDNRQDTITLMYDATLAAWLELSRAASGA